MGFYNDDDDFDFFDFQKENQKDTNNNLEKFNSIQNIEEKPNLSINQNAEQPRFDNFINNNSNNNFYNNQYNSPYNNFSQNNNENKDPYVVSQVCVKKYPKALMIVLSVLIVVSMIVTAGVIFYALDTIDYYKNMSRPVVTPGTESDVALSIASNQIDSVVRIKAYANTSGTSYSAGSGFVITSDGYIVTNFHVIESSVRYSGSSYTGRYDIYVQFNSKVADVINDYVKVTFVNGDPTADIAVLKVDVGIISSGLPEVQPVQLVKDSDEVKMGEVVVALGNPGDIGLLVTSGCVSNPKQYLRTTDYNGYYLITDTTINSGNSGGPLFNSKGEVVGINTFSVTETLGTEMYNINCAIRTNQLVECLEKWNIDYIKAE